MTRKTKLFLLGAFVSGWLFLTSPSATFATESGSEQVIVSPAQQAVNTAISTATTEVQQAIDATAAATTEISQAQSELSSAQTAVSEITSAVSTAQSEVNQIQTDIDTISSIDIQSNPIDQSSQIIVDAKQNIIDATTSVNEITTEITQAQTEVSDLNTARTEAATAQSTAQSQLTEANIAIDNAQNAINALQATIGTTTNVLAGVDDAGIRMNLPFNLQMGGTLYNNIYVGSNATITFGVDEGWVYYQTPNAPSVSIAGWDWTTWSTGTGITYSTTSNTLNIAWDVRPFPQQDASTQMVQIRFNADVNPTDGAWRADVSATGPIPNGARFNYREVTNGIITEIEDTNTGSGFNGEISQGSEFVHTVDPNIAPIQAAIDSANATIFQLNSSLSPVVAQNATNNSALSTLQSNINGLNNTINSAISTKTNLESTLSTRASTLTSTINNNIPTPAPIISQTEVIDGEIVVSVEMPVGYEGNTWFYQIFTEDPNAENPYAGQTLNTDGSPDSFVISGLTEGATYTIRVANWSGAVSSYSATEILIPSTQSSNLTGGGSIDFNLDGNEQTPPDTTTPDEGDDTETEPTPEEPVDDTPSEEPESPDTDTTEPDIPSSNDGQDNSPEENQNTDNSQEDNTITTEEVQDMVEEFLADGGLTSEEKEIIADALIESANGEPISAADISAAGLEFRDLPAATPVEVRTDINGNPVVITAEVASALLTLESPAALIGGIASCINPDETIEGLTEEQKCEVFKALANIGADMSPQERQKAKEVLVAAILVGQVIIGSSILRIRG